MKKKTVSVIMTITMLFQISACGSIDVSENLSDQPGHGKWVDSDLIGSVSKEDDIRLQDDFAAAVNKEIITSVTFSPNQESWGAVDSTVELVQSRYRQALEDESINSATAEVLRSFERLVLDWDERNKLGVEPIRKYIDDIQSITSIDEMTEYQSSIQRNPFNLGLLMPKSVDPQIINVDKSQLSLKVPEYTLFKKENYITFSSDALGAKESADDVMTYLLGRLGYDESSIKGILEGCYFVEQFLAKNDCSSLYNNNEQLFKMQTDRAGLMTYAKGYPLMEILDGRGFSETENFYVDYMLLSKLHKIYDQSHLEELKSFFTVQMLKFGYSTLDRETIEKVTEFGASKTEKDPKIVFPTDDEEFFVMLQKCSFMPAMDTVYLEKYFSDDTKIDKIKRFTDELKKSYSTMVYEEEWLSEETKAATVDKLENMAVQVVRPSNTADYSMATVKEYKEGGTILDAAASAARIVNDHMAERAANPDIDRKFWDI